VDVIVLAGGFAKRMWPLTENTPKHLLSVGGRPMLDYVMERVEALPDDMIDNPWLSVNDAFAPKFQEYIDGRVWKHDWKLFVERSRTEGEKKGSLGALGEIISDTGINSDLLVVGGDNLFFYDLSKLMDFSRKKGGSVVAVYDVGSLEKASLYGIVATDDNGRMSEFLEKPKNPPSTLASTACIYLTKNGVSALMDYLAEGHNADALGNFFHWFVPRSPVYAYRFEGDWFDIGSFESYDEANGKLGTPTNTVADHGN